MLSTAQAVQIPFKFPNSNSSHCCVSQNVRPSSNMYGSCLFANKVDRQVTRNTVSARRMNRGTVFSIPEERSSDAYISRKRNIVEHICLLKAKEGLSDEEEKDMLDYLYTSQYRMRGIVTISLGRLSEPNLERYTHAFIMRFQRKEDLLSFYENPFYKSVVEEHVMPYCHGFLSVDYESKVEDDVLHIFRKGEEFNYGIEFLLLVAFVDDASVEAVEDALASLNRLMLEFPSLVVQSTQGLNFNVNSKEYTHGIIIRFRSLDAFQIFMDSSEYKDVWSSKFQNITSRTISVHFSVDPVGTKLM